MMTTLHNLPAILRKYSLSVFAACDRQAAASRLIAAVDSGKDSAYGQILLVMQVLSCVATSSTVFRVIHDQRLSAWFLLLPGLLVATLAMRRSLNADSVDLLTGLSTGATSAFLAESVGANLVVDSAVRSDGFAVALISQVELMHIPVIAGSLVLAYCVVFERWPSYINSVFLLLVVLSATLAVTIGVMILDETADLGKIWQIFSFVFVTTYLCVLLATVQLVYRPAALCLLSVWFNIYWQWGFFDYWHWDWYRGRFPVCGFLTALIFVFFIERTDVPLDTTKRHQRHMGHFSNSVTWFAVAYCAQRVSLTLLKTRHPFGVRHMTDVWPCCVLMLAYTTVVSPETTVTVCNKVTFTLSCLLLYMTISLPTEGFCNAFFVDAVLGLTSLFAMEASRSRQDAGPPPRTFRWEV